MNSLELYKQMVRIRKTELRIAELYPSDKIQTPIHLAIGQEAVSVAVCGALTREDTVFTTYRSHGPYMAKGGALRAMIAELYGREDGSAAGRAGSMHLGDPDAGVMPASAIVGSTVPVATGMAYGFKLTDAAKPVEKRRVVASFSGDGSFDEGPPWEVMSFAGLHAIPVIYVCENNELAIYTPQSARQAKSRGKGRPDLCARAEAFGVEAHRWDKPTDAAGLHALAQSLVKRARAGEGPFFLEAMTTRLCDHVGPADIKIGGDDDCVAVAAKAIAKGDLDRVHGEVDTEIDAAFRGMA